MKLVVVNDMDDAGNLTMTSAMHWWLLCPTVGCSMNKNWKCCEPTVLLSSKPCDRFVFWHSLYHVLIFGPLYVPWTFC